MLSTEKILDKLAGLGPEPLDPAFRFEDFLTASVLSLFLPKFYAGMELIQLRGHRINDGYRISGSLPFVSNLGADHWFAIIFETDSTHRVLALRCTI
ncbi:hypothetical protein EIZ39_12355 [Ammoniphilus sp. CFH 90114]|nr:hypothetical protein EIZ39_12355 [Ammoniphilus sp. CFH 90114]